MTRNADSSFDLDAYLLENEPLTVVERRNALQMRFLNQAFILQCAKAWLVAPRFVITPAFLHTVVTGPKFEVSGHAMLCEVAVWVYWDELGAWREWTFDLAVECHAVLGEEYPRVLRAMTSRTPLGDFCLIEEYTGSVPFAKVQAMFATRGIALCTLAEVLAITPTVHTAATLPLPPFL